MATPPGTIVSQPVSRQVLPFGDRPIGLVRDGAVYPTLEFYQWTARLASGFTSTVNNVSTVTGSVNTIVIDLGQIDAEIGTLQADVTTIEGEIASLSSGGVAPALPPFPVLGDIPPIGPALPPATEAPVPIALPQALSPMASAFGLAFFFAA